MAIPQAQILTHEIWDRGPGNFIFKKQNDCDGISWRIPLEMEFCVRVLIIKKTRMEKLLRLWNKGKKWKMWQKKVNAIYAIGCLIITRRGSTKRKESVGNLQGNNSGHFPIIKMVFN